MARFFLRCLACLALFLIPLIAIVEISGVDEARYFYLIPILGLIPGFVMALVLFVPVEAICQRIGASWLANLLVPMAGVAGAILSFVALGIYHGDLDVLLRNFARSSDGFVWWGFAAVTWAIIWRITALIPQRARKQA